MTNNSTILLDAQKDGDRLVELLRDGSILPLTVTGYSMIPLLKPGRDVVWLRACTPDELKPGRILFFRRPDGHFILHRIRAVDDDGCLIMNGDAQTWTEKIPPSAAVAVVHAITRNGRKLSPGSIGMKLWDAVWYPTRPIRPALFRCYTTVKRTLSGEKSNPQRGNQ
ncbi:MAG: S24/S26 family peptidase [Clostridia bacterium]|nr:S24/S26 family peptidase [Clostridia bacterium]